MSRKWEKYNGDLKPRPKKHDLFHNSVEVKASELSKLDKGKVRLKINDRLTILVSPEKCNEEYAAEYREKLERRN
jgi:hypothetical protein